MYKLLLILTLILLTISCGPTKTGNSINTKNKKEKDTLKTVKGVKSSGNNYSDTVYYPAWADSLIANYILKSNYVLMKMVRKYKINEEWNYDQPLYTDTATYLIFQLGHDVSDKDGEELRFVTDQWILIDSLTRQLYEDDLANEYGGDSLIRWPK